MNNAAMDISAQVFVFYVPQVHTTNQWNAG